MPPEVPIPGSPSDWLSRARSDLAIAKVPLPEGAVYEDLCFHAQQAAEKAIKAVYRANGLVFRYTHDLEELLRGLQERGIVVPAEVKAAADLSDFAWEARYPRIGEPVGQSDYLEAVTLAERVVRWAQTQVKGADR